MRRKRRKYIERNRYIWKRLKKWESSIKEGWLRTMQHHYERYNGIVVTQIVVVDEEVKGQECFMRDGKEVKPRKGFKWFARTEPPWGLLRNSYDQKKEKKKRKKIWERVARSPLKFITLARFTFIYFYANIFFLDTIYYSDKKCTCKKDYISQRVYHTFNKRKTPKKIIFS